MNLELLNPSRIASVKCLFNSNLKCIKTDHQSCDNCPVIREARLSALKEVRKEEHAHPGQGAIIRRKKNMGCSSIFHVPIPPRQLTRRPRRRKVSSRTRLFP